MHQHFEKIKETYLEFEHALLRAGKVPFKETEKGLWGVTHLDALFELFQKLKLDTHNSFIDIGSGDGRVVLVAALFGVKALGIECDPWLVDTSLKLRRRINLPHCSKARLLEGDFMEHNLSEYNIVYCSPDKPFYRTTMEQKLLTELEGKLIVHGWEFHPQRLHRENELIVQGEKFGVYSSPRKGFS